MTKISKQQISDKLQKLNVYVRYLNKVKKDVGEDQGLFKNDVYYFGVAERYLQLSIQVLIDVVQMIIIEKSFEKPSDNQEAISLLFSEKVISKKLASHLDGIVGFRNILVHEYAKIDLDIVFSCLQDNIDDFKLFKKEIAVYLKK